MSFNMQDVKFAPACGDRQTAAEDYMRVSVAMRAVSNAWREGYLAAMSDHFDGYGMQEPEHMEDAEALEYLKEAGGV